MMRGAHNVSAANWIVLPGLVEKDVNRDNLIEFRHQRAQQNTRQIIGFPPWLVCSVWSQVPPHQPTDNHNNLTASSGLWRGSFPPISINHWHCWLVLMILCLTYDRDDKLAVSWNSLLFIQPAWSLHLFISTPTPLCATQIHYLR